MENIVTEEFIKRYAYLYFDPDSCPEDYIFKHYESMEGSKKNILKLP